MLSTALDLIIWGNTTGRYCCLNNIIRKRDKSLSNNSVREMSVSRLDTNIYFSLPIKKANNTDDMFFSKDIDFKPCCRTM